MAPVPGSAASATFASRRTSPLFVSRDVCFGWDSLLCLLMAGLVAAGSWTAASAAQTQPVASQGSVAADREALDRGAAAERTGIQFKGRREDFETRPVVLFPGQFTDEAKQNRYKLGHWAIASLRVIANSADSTGQLHAYLVDPLGQPVPVAGTDFVADSSRPFTLPRGQEKNFETLVFLPQRTADAAAANIQVKLTTPTGLPVVDTIQPVLLLKPHQYHLVVLAANLEEYRYLRLLDCVQLPQTGFASTPPFYSVVYPSSEQPAPLPGSALAWTTIAHLLWDQTLPEELSAEQQQALLDWLHFGGQLIISGPGSLEKLRGSFLEPSLPVEFIGGRNLAAGDFAEFNRYWAPAQAKNPALRRDLVVPDSAPMLGLSWKLVEGASELPGAEGLVAERLIGRGRVVVTAFPLSEKRLQTWPGFASFFNAALLRRPGRIFSSNAFDEVSFNWRDDRASIFDPLLGSALRFAARDLPTSGWLNSGSQWSPPAAEMLPVPDGQPLGSQPGPGPEELRRPLRNLARDPWHYGGFEADPQGGVAAWNDEVGVAAAARESISLAAGISPPSADFVFRLLGLYLLCLVPLNWLLFRLLGRVEWAWLAAPLIAIIGAIVVVRLAALDIGFVRSQSQIGLLEIPVAYERGHLAEYSALYTSLSTRYELQFDDLTGVALPFPARQRSPERRLQPSLRPVYLERTLNNRLRDFFVQSNSTGMLHGENFLSLGGRLELVASATGGQAALKNGTTLDLLAAGVIERTPTGTLRRAWLGTCAAGEQRPLDFQEIPEAELYQAWKDLPEFQSLEQRCRAIWEAAFGSVASVSLAEVIALPEFQPLTNQAWQYFRRVFSSSRVDPLTRVTFPQFKLAYSRLVFAAERRELGLGEMFDALADCLSLAPGEVRLLARSLAVVGDHRLKPAATRVTRSNLILAHLRSPPLPVPQPDENTLLDLFGKSQLDWLQEQEQDELAEPGGEDD